MSPRPDRGGFGAGSALPPLLTCGAAGLPFYKTAGELVVGGTSQRTKINNTRAAPGRSGRVGAQTQF